jgi:threonyl-tRNA synthetase
MEVPSFPGFARWNPKGTTTMEPSEIDPANREPDAYDHRVLGRRLDLFHFQEEAPGMAFWHPNGWRLYRLLEEAARRASEGAGYLEVATPQILRRPVWEKSGHWSHFLHGMFQVLDQDQEAAVKPVSCPGHIQILQARRVSYRELPIRLSEFGRVHRDEQKGALHGLLRLRQFTQDDGHVFCLPDQARDEVERFCRSLPPFYAAFGFRDLAVAFSTRPAERAGGDAAWDESEAALRDVLERLDVPFRLQEGEGAFYGPKLEFTLKDRQGREWQCGTIQFDLVMPPRFGLEYVDADGERKPMVMLHRALYGSLERFLGILLEHHGPFLPPWLAPAQARVLPVSGRHLGWAETVAGRLREAGIRCGISPPDESLPKRIALANEEAVPFVAVVGDREAGAESVSIRSREGVEVLQLEEAVGKLARRCDLPSFFPQGGLQK